ncbi:MAG: hypothetical protein U1F35_14770 [Steroidobacteraceae bacterium]
MRRKVIWRGLLAGALPLSLAPATAIIAADYLSVEDAQRAAFAQARRFVPVALALTAEQRRASMGWRTTGITAAICGSGRWSRTAPRRPGLRR